MCVALFKHDRNVREQIRKLGAKPLSELLLFVAASVCSQVLPAGGAAEAL